MKKITLATMLILLCILLQQKSLAQVSSLFNTGTGTDYLGWANSMNGTTLKIKTEAPDHINFYTNAGTGTFLNQRMTIIGSNTIGYLGSNNTGWVGIGVTSPLTHVQIGDGTCDDTCSDGVPGTWRRWMKEGYYACKQSDDVYIGLKDSVADHRDAVIAWGDNNRSSASWGPDHLKFIFTEYCQDPSPDPRAVSYSGLEVARVTPEGYWGIGTDFYQKNINGTYDPIRRLEVVDSLDQAQLRLDFSNGNYGTTYIYSDFKTTSLGNLLIDPENVGAHAAKRVGIGPLTTFGSTEPAAKLEVYDNSGTLAQLRLTNSLGANWTDFTTDASGRMYFNASGNKFGFETAAPGNTVEINSGSAGTSGLRFTQLTNANVPIANPTNGVLSLNSSGDVIWVNDGTGTGNLSACAGGLPVNYITKGTSSTTICNSQIYEDGTGTYQAIGYTNNFPAKWSVRNITGTTINTGIYTEAPQTGVKGVANGSIGGGNTIVGVFGIADGTNNTGNLNTGVYGWVTASSSSGSNYGLFGRAYATPAYQNIGGLGQARDASLNNFGLVAAASSGSNAFGIKATASLATNNYAVYGDATYSLANYAGYFNGNLATTAGWSVPSDSILKTDINEITDALQVLKNISGYTYRYKTDSYPSINLPTDDKIPGLISEQVQTVIPSAVHTIIHPAVYDSVGNKIYDEIKYLGLDYCKLIPYLVVAVNQLNAQLNECCSSKGYRAADPNENNNSGTQTVDLKSSTANYLGQSIPNPHTTQCTIPYRIDPTVTKAEIVFADQLGAEISRVEIVTRGEGQLTVLSSQLEDGLYTYSLIADGKLIDTKKMVKQH